MQWCRRWFSFQKIIADEKRYTYADEDVGQEHFHCITTVAKDYRNWCATYHVLTHRTVFISFLTLKNNHSLIRGAIEKFCNSVWCTSGTDKTITLFFDVISLNINRLLTFVKKFFYSSQIEFLGHVVEIRLHGLLQLIIIEKPRSAKVLLQMSK